MRLSARDSPMQEVPAERPAAGQRKSSLDLAVSLEKEAAYSHLDEAADSR